MAGMGEMRGEGRGLARVSRVARVVWVGRGMARKEEKREHRKRRRRRRAARMERRRRWRRTVEIAVAVD